MMQGVSDNYVREFLRIFFANSRLIKRVFFGFVVITFSVLLLVEKTFELTGEVIVLSKRLNQTHNSELVGGVRVQYIPASLADMETEANILRSLSLIRKTVSELSAEGKFYQTPSFFQVYIKQPIKETIILPLRTYVIDPVKEALGLTSKPKVDNEVDKLVDLAVDSLNIKTIPGSNIILVMFSCPDAKMGVNFVNKLLDNYLMTHSYLLVDEGPSSVFLKKKRLYKQNFAQLEQKKLTLLNKYKVANPQQELVFTVESIENETKELNDYQDAYAENEEWLKYLEKHWQHLKRVNNLSVNTVPFSFTRILGTDAYDDKEIHMQSERVTLLYSEYSTALFSYKQGSFKVKQIKKRLAHERSRFIALIKNRILERKKSLDITAFLIKQKKQRINKLNVRAKILKEVKLLEEQLDIEINAIKEALFAYSQKYEEKRAENLAEANGLSNVKILSWPFIPPEPAFPKPKLIIPLGIMTGLILALSLGYLKEFFDHTFKHPNHVSKYLGIPVIAVIDDISSKKKKSI
jgi:uncharacterized protein involved in exopolysaccharide biosynthesis